jgi:PAS domain S-box-containing protein
VDWAWIAAIHPDDRDILADYWRSASVSGASLELEARMRRFDGEYRWFLFRASALRDATGRILKWYGTNTDIEDRRRAEQAARASERGFRLIVDSIPGLVSIMSAAGELEFVNRQLLQYFGRSLQELKSWATTDAVHPDDLARTVAGWRRAVESGRTVDLEHRLRRGDGVYNWFHFRATPLLDANGQVSRWYALLTDASGQLGS